MFYKLVTIAFALVLFSCGGSGGVDDGSDFVITSRVDNPDIPAEHAGLVSNNIRSYSVNPDGYKASVLVNGLNGDLVVRLNDEYLTIDNNSEQVFISTFPAGTNITAEIDSLPFLQDCAFANSLNTGMIRSDSTLQFIVNCEDSHLPSTPVITQIYSSTIDSIDFIWVASTDRDTLSSDITYRIYYSQVQAEVESRGSAYITTAAGDLEAKITTLNADTLYYFVIEAFDADGNYSQLSGVRELKTISTPNLGTGTPFYNINSNNINISGNTWTVPVTEFNNLPQVGEVLISDLESSFKVVRILSVINDAANYVINTEPGELSDIVKRLSISSDTSLNETDLSNILPGSGAVTTANFAKNDTTLLTSQKVSRLKISACRNPTVTLTQEQLNQIEIENIYKFDPRVLNNLVVDLSNPFSPTLTGSIEYIGNISVGIKTVFVVSDTISGSFVCELAGLPLKRTFTYPSGIGPLPVVQDVSLDAKIVINFSSELNLNGSAKFVAHGTLSGKLYKDAITNQWVTENPDLQQGYETEYGLNFTARLRSRAAIIPKLSTTLYKAATVSLSAESGANASITIDIIDSNGPVLEEFSADADIKLLLAADFTMFGYTFFDLPEREIYTSPTFKIFDTSETCTNESPSKENCQADKIITRNPDDKKIDLILYSVDGTNNKFDLGSVKWDVTPANGHIEVNKDDPRKAVLNIYDEEAYTVTASANGRLGKVARKYVQFSLEGSCQYGLDKALPPGSEAYFLSADKGYIFPRNYSSEITGYRESCFIPDVGHVNFYAGQRHGRQVKGGIEETYENGMLIFSRNTFLSAFVNFIVMPDPDSIFNYSVGTYHFERLDDGGTDEVSVNFSRGTITFIFISSDKTKYVIVTTLPSKPDRPIGYGHSEQYYDFDTGANVMFYNPGDPITNAVYYSDGRLHRSEVHETQVRTQCGWTIDGENVDFEYKVAGTDYKCFVY